MENKRFPANNKKLKDLFKEESSFLTDKKIDGELYAYLQSKSIAGTKTQETKEGKGIYNAKVFKKDLGTQKHICEKIGLKSAKTYRVHLQYLIDKGYVIDENDYYILPNLEEFYLLIPKDTLEFFQDVVKEPVIKTYILLGTMWNWKKERYEFSAADICEHLGINPTKESNIDSVNNYLIALKKFELIDYEEIYKKIGNITTPKKRLIYYSFNKPNDR